MSKQHYILNITNPCTQDWNSMQPDKDGRHCTNCSKTVIDFTTLTDGQILQKIKETNGNICGRLSGSQISRPLIEPVNNPFYARFYKFLAGLLIFSTPKITNAIPLQIPNEILEIHEQEIKNISESTNDQVLPNDGDTIPNTIEGKLVDATTGEPLQYANVMIKNTRIGVITDLDGYFKLDIPHSFLSDSIHVQFAYVGYVQLDTIFYKKDLPITSSDKLIIMLEGGILIGDISVFKEKKQKMSKRLKD